MKNRILLTVFFYTSVIATAIAQCDPATPYTTITLQTSTEVYLHQNTPGGVYYIEYGLHGFTPGTGSTPGAGGTLMGLPAGSSFFPVTGLTAGTQYDVYCRKNCSGIWGVNSPVYIFNTLPACNSLPSIACNNMITSVHPEGQGTDGGFCSGGAAGSEKFYTFIPSVTGTHRMYVPITSGRAEFSYRLTSLGCNPGAWTCIGEYTGSIFPSQFNFGPLTAGVSYIIRVDLESSINAVGGTTLFRIECPHCSTPSNVASVNVDPTSTNFTWTGLALNSCVEYGPGGFVPGTGFIPGVNGIIMFSSTNNIQLTGLTPGTVYDFYVRTNCNGSLFSPNSTVYRFITMDCPNVMNYQVGSPSTGFPLPPQPGSLDHIGSCSTAPIKSGLEHTIRFESPYTGYLIMNYSSAISQVNGEFALGLYGNCNITNAICKGIITPAFPNGSFELAPLDSGLSYDVYFDYEIGQSPSSIIFQIECPKPLSVLVDNVQSTTARVSWSCMSSFAPCPANQVIEYGPLNFVPGTGATAGTGGTVVTPSGSQTIVSGLSPNTTYDVYVRYLCGTIYSPNSAKVTFKTALDCNAAPVITCGSYFSYIINPSSTAGVWNITTCGNNNLNAQEIIYSFTPSQSGVYTLNAYSSGSVTTSFKTSIFVKSSTLGCTSLSWNCIGTLNGTGANFVSTLFPLGNMNAGETYYIMLDGQQPGSTYSYNFRLECPNVCPPPLLSNPTSILYQSVQINGTCPQCTGTLYLEYGPAGFIPGTTNSPGTGTVIPNISFPFTVGGLTPGTTYDFYVRQNCGAPLGYSPNSVKRTATPCFSQPTGITSNVPGNTICQGSSITLTQSGGALPPGGSFKWYTGTCGQTLVGTGNSITVSPTINTTYRVRVESPCGNSSCSPALTVTVGTSTATITPTGPISLCPGGTVVLNANTGINLTYQWFVNAVLIPGATNSSYTAGATGNYTVAVTGASGCSGTSVPVIVTVHPIPTVSFSGLAATYQSTDPTVILSGSPAGGSFSGTGVSGNTFSPALAGVGGPYTITYSYTSPFGCFNSSSQQTTVTGCTGPPAQPGAISTSGGTSVCPGESKSYSIMAVPAANSYTWTAPSGGTITSGQGTISVTVSYGAGFTTAGNLTVVASNNCGNSAQRTLQINRNNPVMPSSITGNASGLCTKTGEPFSVPVVAGITNNWSFNTGNATIASGQGTNAITANFNAAFTTTAVLSVTASNGCGTSAAKTLTVNAKPATPGTITGALFVCANQQGVPYSIVPLYGVTNYSWVSPKKSHPSDGIVTSNNTNLTTTASAITVNYGNSGGDLKVRGNNACGSSAYSITTIIMNCRVIGEPESVTPEITVFPNPAQDVINVNVIGCDTYDVELFNVLGESLILEQNATRLDLSVYRAGLYMIQVTCEGKVLREKVIIEK